MLFLDNSKSFTVMSHEIIALEKYVFVIKHLQ